MKLNKTETMIMDHLEKKETFSSTTVRENNAITSLIRKRLVKVVRVIKGNGNLGSYHGNGRGRYFKPDYSSTRVISKF